MKESKTRTSAMEWGGAWLHGIWFRASLLLVLFVAAYWVPLKAIVTTWWNNEDYSYGFIIPVVSAYLIWERRKILREIPEETTWKILPLLVFFVLLSIYGILGSSGNVSMPCMPILIILFTAFCFGMHAVKHLIFPLGFLVFMVPIPASIDRTLGLGLKSISSKLGGMLIGLMDIPVHVTGNIIDIGATQLQVVDACSGMRYILPLLALGTVYAYFFERINWKRIVCVIATIPIALMLNVFRIAITGALTEWYGVAAAEGFFHGFSGWILFMAAFSFLFGVGRILRLFRSKVPEASDKELSEGSQSSNAVSRGRTTPGFVVSILLLVLVGGLSLSTKTLPAMKISGGLESFPLQFATWEGRSELVRPDIVIESGAEEAFSGFYKTQGNAVSLYLGYRSTAFLSNENFFHSPTVCLPSSGWTVQDKGKHTVKDVPALGQVPVTKMVIDSQGVRQLVYFWFQTKSRVTGDKNINRFHLALHAIQRDNSYDFFIRPITTVSPNETIEEAEARMDRFIRDMMPALLSFLKERQYEEKR